VDARVKILPQKRKSLALKVTPAGIQVLIPQHLEPASPEVETFVAESLADLAPSAPVPPAERLDRQQLVALVDQWAGRLGVDMGRVQIQPMSAKWGSISTAGNLTLARDVLRLPRPLVDYIICHELLHLQVPHHNRLYRLLLSRYIPDWRQRERELGRWALALRATALSG
jgi:predicted metal-dependent hydrolase